MILLLGPIADPVLANVCARLAARNAEMALVHPDSGDVSWNLAWSTVNGAVSGQILLGSRLIEVSDIDAAFVRSFGNGRAANETDRMRMTALWEWTDSLPTLVVNKRKGVHTNMSKPYQQRLIAQQGFAVPKTLITMLPEAARAFYEECEERVIYKSISAERSIVKQLTAEDLPRLDQIKDCPVQLQALVPGIDIRVHTVGDRVFASEILADRLDYRYVSRDGGTRTIRAIELPQDIQARCLTLAKSLGLVTTGIDLRRTPDGEYYCFEVNTSPAFTFYENQTGQRIGDAVADLLCGGRA
jgi:glutathione synthase/RimK-type ligase-like ATP-grasp enzyme